MKRTDYLHQNSPQQTPAIAALNEDALYYAYGLGMDCNAGEFSIPKTKITFTLENNGASQTYNIYFTMNINTDLKAAFWAGYNA